LVFLWPFGILYDHLVYFWSFDINVCFSRFGILYQEKSGNPGAACAVPMTNVGKKDFRVLDGFILINTFVPTKFVFSYKSRYKILSFFADF
jgi:hypothetical protein